MKRPTPKKIINQKPPAPQKNNGISNTIDIRFGFWDRFKILFGYSLNVTSTVACENYPGKVTPVGVRTIVKRAEKRRQVTVLAQESPS